MMAVATSSAVDGPATSGERRPGERSVIDVPCARLAEDLAAVVAGPAKVPPRLLGQAAVTAYPR
jgi:hypothetical protein